MSALEKNTGEWRICNCKIDVVPMEDGNIFLPVEYNAEKADSKHSYIKC